MAENKKTKIKLRDDERRERPASENNEEKIQDNEINEKQETLQEKPNYLEMAQRIQADFENYKRRNKDIIQESFSNGVAVSVEKLLPALDSFNQATKNIQDKKVLDGINLIYNQLKNALLELGVTKIECVGKPFDPNFHNAVLTGENRKKKDGIVLEEYQEGFMLNKKVIRHSVVKINKLNQEVK